MAGKDDKELIDVAQIERIATAVVQKIFTADPKASTSFYKRVIKSQVFIIGVLLLITGFVAHFGYEQIAKMIEVRKEVEQMRVEKDTYTKRADLAEKALSEEREIKNDLSKSLRTKGLELLSARYAEVMLTHYAKIGTNKYNKKFTHLKKVAKLVIDAQRYFPTLGRTNKERIIALMAIMAIETGYNPDVIGSHGEVTMAQIMKKDIKRLMGIAIERRFAVNDDPKDLRTTIILMSIHLEEKIANNNGDRSEGVRRYNGNPKVNPSYWLNFLQYQNILGDVEVDEKLFEEDAKGVSK